MEHLQIYIDNVDDDSYWVTGTVGNGTYKFYSKVEDEKSEQGIHKGRVVKLVVRKGEVLQQISEEDFWKDVVASYERSWSIKPKNPAAKEIFYAILDELERIKKYNDRIYNGSRVKKIIGQTKKSFGI